MKKGDILTPLGFIVGWGLVVWAMGSGGNDLMMFVDMPSLAITVGGAIGGILIAYTLEDIKLLAKVTIECFKTPKLSKMELIELTMEMSKKARRDGLLSLESDLEKTENPFFKKGMQLAVDGVDADAIRDILESDIGEMERRHSKGANIFKTFGSFLPAFGMVGTLIGLIQMLADLGGDAGAIAAGMSKALITTFYGSLFANLVFIPMANNLNIKSEEEVVFREMMITAIMGIQSGESSNVLEEQLCNYLTPKERDKYLSSK